MAREYLAMAEHLLHPPHPCLVAVGGFSGSGKSTLALGLAPSVGAVPGAVVLRSDETRKRLCGVPLLQRLGPEGYSSHVSERVLHLGRTGRTRPRAGHSVVVDAVYARAADRRVIEQVAEAASVPFIGLWLDAPESLLIDRLPSAATMRPMRTPTSFACSALKTSATSVGLALTHRCRRACAVIRDRSVRERLHDVLNVVADEAR